VVESDRSNYDIRVIRTKRKENESTSLNNDES
jgi:hypothetical protein